MDALSTQSIVKRYANHLALNQVSLSIPEKSIFGLLGPNGAGKTTLIRIINQIIQQDEGEIMFFGEKLDQKHIGQIGYLPEERGLYKKLKVGEQLVYLARLKGLSKNEALEKSKRWMVKFDIKEWWNKKVEDLSKGMAQKVQFISTVMHEPRLIILDEPFSGFDPVNAERITQEILELKEKGSTIIFSTHRMETVEALCDHISLIHQSEQILSGEKKEIKNRYKTNTYTVIHRGALLLPEDRYAVMESASKEDVSQSTIKILHSAGPNTLLQDLLPQIEILGFAEKVPSMSEIFISLVKGGGRE